ncbi:MAG: hypothetical protein KAR42_00130 [candidate division Zixibacteria bacterium]|nr:hypothetical protein [candidate division Zixibacteria bacterium]
MKYLIPIIILFALLSSGAVCFAGAFGEAALSGGIIYPQGTFNRYADQGGVINFRITIHIPQVEMFAGWFDFGLGRFSRDEFETYKKTEIPNGPTFYDPITQITSEDMVTSHIGLQLASMTRKAFFRPRAALGFGLYGFSHKIEWTEEDGDSTVAIATESLHHKTCWGWRAVIGADLFFTPQWGASFDVVYDHVFNLRQKETMDVFSKNTSRFNGFTVGIVYMFETGKK